MWVRTGFRLRVIIQKGFLMSPAANQKGPKPLNSGPFDRHGKTYGSGMASYRRCRVKVGVSLSFHANCKRVFLAV